MNAAVLYSDKIYKHESQAGACSMEHGRVHHTDLELIEPSMQYK